MGGGGDNVGIGHGILVHAGSDEARDVRHIDHEISADGIGDLAELLEIDDPCIGTGTGYDQFRMTFVCDPSDFFVIDHAVIVYAIRYNVKICTGKICRASVCQMSAVCKVHAHHGISRL